LSGRKSKSERWRWKGETGEALLSVEEIYSQPMKNLFFHRGGAKAIHQRLAEVASFAFRGIISKY